MEQTAHSVFISYARDDSDWVTIAVNLLIAGGAKVFMDVRDIAYGDKWEEVLLEKLREVERVMVFWSRQAADSDWVTKEWQLALKNGKRLVPVPIDDTPLPDDLSQFQALTDLKPLLQRHQSLHGGGEGQPTTPAARTSSPSWLRPVLLAGAVAFPVAIAAWLFLREEPRLTTVTPVEPPIGTPGEPAIVAAFVSFPWFWAIGAVALLMLIAWLVKRWLESRVESESFEEFKSGAPYDLTEEILRPEAVALLESELADRTVKMVFEEPDKPS